MDRASLRLTSFPCVLKPLRFESGVMRVETDSARAAFRRLRARRFATAGEPKDTRDLALRGFVDGAVRVEGS